MRFATFLLFFGLLASQAWALIKHYDYIIKETSYTRLCSTKKILTVNGEFPGPIIYANKGDTAIVNVQNQGEYNITLHWHGLSQPRNSWSDGPEYITQCPIQPGAKFKYHLIFSHEEGTIWWHAHSAWDRATVHGAIIVYPKIGAIYPFPNPHREIPIILGEWWKSDINQILADPLETGSDFNISDAYTINGQPGDLYPCSSSDTFITIVEHQKTYLLRVINAALNNDLFFAIADHELTIVGTDGSYLKPFTTSYIMITPGQTFDILLHANAASGSRFYMAASSYGSADLIPYDVTTTTAILQYKTSDVPTDKPKLPSLPKVNDSKAALDFVKRLQSLTPVNVPKTIDERIIMTVSVNLLKCEPGKTCKGPQGERFSMSLNNISFLTPSIDLLQAYHKNISGVFGTGFPSEPPLNFDFTSNDLPSYLLYPRRAVEVRVVEYNTNLEIVFQGTGLFAPEYHPMHLHGYSFYTVGSGPGNFDKEKDPLKYNLINPPFQNTVGVPKNGWSAIRFKALNPGVWFMHCHIDIHSTWGMATVLIVKNGKGLDAGLLPPPPYMPPC